jgi:hypothetical protein
MNTRVLIFLSISALFHSAALADSVMLFSESEAEKLTYDEVSFDSIAPGINAVKMRGTSSSSNNINGPIVKLHQPKLDSSKGSNHISVETPTPLHIQFIANNANIDMESLEVEARKGIFSKSLTKKVLPYFVNHSINIEQLNIPSGNFLISILINDVEGNKTIATYRLSVK